MKKIEDFEIGDIVSCGPNWWRIKEKSSQRLHLEMVMDKHGKLPKKKAREYLISPNWCQKVSITAITAKMESENKKWKTLLKIIDPELIDPEEDIGMFNNLEKPELEIFQKLGLPRSLSIKK